MFLVVQSKLVTWNSLSWKVVTCGNSSLGTVWVGKLWLVKGCDPDYQKHVSSQLLGFQHPQNSKLLNQRMERSNQEQEQLRHQLGLTQSAFETWLFFQEATARQKEETFQDPQRSKRWEAGLPFRVECKNNQKKSKQPSQVCTQPSPARSKNQVSRVNLARSNSTHPRASPNFAPANKLRVEDLSQELVNRGNWFRRNMASGSRLQPWHIIIKFLASFEAWSQN